MDTQINKIKRDLDRGERDTKTLLRMDKKQDAKVKRLETAAHKRKKTGKK